MLIVAAVISSLVLDGSIDADHVGDYVVIEFALPAGTVELEVAHHSVSAGNILDWGLWDGEGFRGWGGGLEDDAIVGVDAASRGYLPGPMSGTWQLVIGKASLSTLPAVYELTVVFRDAATIGPRARSAYLGETLASGPRWYRGDLHVHSNESGDASATFDDIIALARDQRLDFVALSDHNTVSQHGLAATLQQSTDDVLLIRAAEVTTYAGHTNAFGFADYIDHLVGLDARTAAEIFADIAAQGGIASINHPALDLGGACIGCAWTHADTPWAQVAAIEIHTGNYQSTVGLFTPRAIALWDEQLDAGYRLAAVGGSDDHRAGQGTGTNDTPLGAPTTLVYAAELSETAILDGIRAGRTIVLLRGPDDPIVELFVKSGDQRAMIGDTLTGAHAIIEARVIGGAGLDLGVVQSGEPTQIQPITSDDATIRFDIDIAEAGDRVRVEVLDAFVPVTVTSHVYLDYAPDGTGGCCHSSRGGGGPAGTALLALLVLIMLRRAGVVRR